MMFLKPINYSELETMDEIFYQVCKDQQKKLVANS